MIDMVMASMPRIETISVAGAYKGCERDDVYTTANSEYLDRVEFRLYKSARRYRLRALLGSYRELPPLRVVSHSFRSQTLDETNSSSSGDGGERQVRYLAIPNQMFGMA